MSTVDKTQARIDALAALGLDPQANSDDIRDAWRKIAFRAHPDHKSKNDTFDFARAKAAYDYLRAEGYTVRGAANSDSRMPRRPRVRKRLIELPQEDIATCRALLDPDRAIEHSARPANDTSEPSHSCSDHVPDAIGCFGRHLTYFVATPVCEGPNRVALPTSVLVSTRRMATEVLSFQSKDKGAGEVVIPEAIREEKFPGAKSVRIRFAANQDIRDEFWMAS